MANIFSPYFDKCFVEGRYPRLDCSEPLLIGFSARNRAFSRAFFSNAIAVAERYFSRLEIIVVDMPYAYNDAARRGEHEPNTDDLMKALRTGDERSSMVGKVIATHKGRVTVVKRRWADVSHDPVVQLLEDELRVAYQRRSKLFDALVNYSNLWARGAEGDARDNYTNFLISEFPVFVKLYYSDNYLHDLYPGPNFKFFEKLEDAHWADELPLATQMAAGKNLSFLNVGYESANV